MGRHTLVDILGIALFAILAMAVYSGPKTIDVGNLKAGGVASKVTSGVPDAFGDLLTVDGGYLYFVDGQGTIRRVSLDQNGDVQVPVLLVPRPR